MNRQKNFDLPSSDREMFLILKNQSSSDNKEKLSLVRKAMIKVIEEQLTSRQKEFIVLYYYEGWQMVEIAKHCNVNVSTVSRTISRARNNIFRYLKYYLY